MKLRKRVQKFRKKLSYFCNGCNKKHIKKLRREKALVGQEKKFKPVKFI